MTLCEPEATKPIVVHELRHQVKRLLFAEYGYYDDGVGANAILEIGSPSVRKRAFNHAMNHRRPVPRSPVRLLSPSRMHGVGLRFPAPSAGARS